MFTRNYTSQINSYHSECIKLLDIFFKNHLVMMSNTIDLKNGILDIQSGFLCFTDI